jgi:predicted lipoprotein with Yx(FWY)xxD motif
MTRRRSLPLLLAVAGLAAAIAAPAGTSFSLATGRATVQAKSSRYGPILFDGRGFALYAFTSDKTSSSKCYGACAAAWPPYIVRGKLSVGAGLKRALLGTTRRKDGKLQATYAGQPLYYYVGDRSAGQILCQNVAEFGGTWLVVARSGKLVR